MKKYKLTLVASLMGICSQAVATNLIAVIFVPLMSLYGFTFVHLGILVGVNFGVQIAVDLIFAPLIDRIGYRRLILPACLLACVGLVLLSATPLLGAQNAFGAMLAATAVFAASCGLMEILLSPMVTAMDEDRGRYVSLLHSAYAWGQVITIIVTTLLLMLLGARLWYVIPLIWALLPAACFIMFLKAPYPLSIEEHKRTRAGRVMRSPTFILLLIAIFLGAAAEVTINQWASTFAEKALGMDKTTGDLLCMCGFAAALGLGRLLYSLMGGKSLQRLLILSALGAFLCYAAAALCPVPALCVAAFILCGLCTALLWPGTALTATECFPLAGSWLYASLAVLGDTGAAVVPLLTGSLADTFSSGDAGGGFAAMLGVSTQEGGLRLALLCASVFPLLCALAHLLLKRSKERQEKTVPDGNQ